MSLMKPNRITSPLGATVTHPYITRVCRRKLLLTNSLTSSSIVIIKHKVKPTIHQVLHCTGLLAVIFTARIRSLGQGYMFTGVCLSTGGCACSGGVSAPVVPVPGECLLPGGCLLWGGGLVETPDPPDGYCCGQYASYWNAFLFSHLFSEILFFFKLFSYL